jgi:hypothetical protein
MEKKPLQKYSLQKRFFALYPEEKLVEITNEKYSPKREKKTLKSKKAKSISTFPSFSS